MPFDRVRETSVTTGTGPLTLAGAPAGFRAFADVYTPSDTIYYAIVAVDGSGVPTGDWEIGAGVLDAGTLLRDSVSASSNANALVSFGTGTKQVFDSLSVQAVSALSSELAATIVANAIGGHVLEADPHGDRAYVDGYARPGVTALGSDTIVVSITGTRLQTRTAAGAVTLDATDYTADREVVVAITNGTGGALAVTAVGAWVWLTDQPTTLAAGERGVLSLLSTTAVEGGTFAAWAVEV